LPCHRGRTPRHDPLTGIASNSGCLSSFDIARRARRRAPRWAPGRHPTGFVNAGDSCAGVIGASTNPREDACQLGAPCSGAACSASADSSAFF
jgi:hypothetical protein